MIPLALLKERLGIEPLDTEFDTMLIELESSAVTWFENRTSRYFGPLESVQVTLRGIRFLALIERPRIPEGLSPPLTDHVTVTEQRYPGDPEAAVIDPADPEGWVIRDVELEAAQLYRKGGVHWRQDREYVVAFTRGYPWNDEPTNDLAAPDDVRQAVIKRITHMFQSRQGVVTGPVQGSIGSYSFSYATVPSSIQQQQDEVESTVRFWQRLIYA